MPETPRRRLLLINPNTSTSTTDRLCQVLAPLLPPDVRLDARTATLGAKYIACEASHAVAAHATLETWAEYVLGNPNPLHGVLIGCFGDPGLFALRESSGCSVTGLAEASFIQASRSGPFAVVTGGERWKPMLMRLAASLGYGELLRHVETVAPTGAMLLADPQLAMHHLTQACRAAALAGAKSIIVGGAGLAGYAALLQASSELPLIDSAEAGLKALLEGWAPAPGRDSSGFVADWSNVSPAMRQLAAY